MGSDGTLLKGTWVIGNVIGDNIQRYLIDGEEFNLTQLFVDLATVGLEVFSMKNAASDLVDAQMNPKCFVAGTLILTAGGYVLIEDIQAGDEVVSMDYETGEVAVKKVVQTFENESNVLIHVQVDGEVISTTPEHPFYVAKFGWTHAINLRAGDILVLSNGEYVIVELIQHEILEAPVKVYNFEVEDYHTYFVGESGVLVHNSCTDVQGKGHGPDKHHEDTINGLRDDFAQYGYGTSGVGGDYDSIYANRSLNTAGLNGNQRPDLITARTVNGTTIYDIYEFASPSQSSGKPYFDLLDKISDMQTQNPNVNIHLFEWGNY